MGWFRLYFINSAYFQNQTELMSLCICNNMKYNASLCYKTTFEPFLHMYRYSIFNDYFVSFFFFFFFFLGFNQDSIIIIIIIIIIFFLFKIKYEMMKRVQTDI